MEVKALMMVIEVATMTWVFLPLGDGDGGGDHDLRPCFLDGGDGGDGVGGGDHDLGPWSPPHLYSVPAWSAVSVAICSCPTRPPCVLRTGARSKMISRAAQNKLLRPRVQTIF